MFSQFVSAKTVHQFNLRIVYVDDVKEIPIVSEYGFKAGVQLGASFVDPRTGNCTIIVVKPASEEDWHRLAIFYHEVRHCYDGPFHK